MFFFKYLKVPLQEKNSRHFVVLLDLLTLFIKWTPTKEVSYNCLSPGRGEYTQVY